MTLQITLKPHTNEVNGERINVPEEVKTLHYVWHVDMTMGKYTFRYQGNPKILNICLAETSFPVDLVKSIKTI